MGRLGNIHSYAVSVLRGGRGMYVSRGAAKQPAQVLELWEFEACPYCRKVREVLSELDLDFVSHPCARGSNNREQAVAIGGKAQFPLLVDADAGVTLYESEAIIDHLYARYGSGRAGWARAVSPLNTLESGLASAVRPRGRVARAPGREQPAQRLELWNFEASPYCRKVREALHELNLDFRVHNVAKRSVKRKDLVARGGKMQVPYLVDPNTGTAMYESDDIVAYLERTYG